MLSFFGRRSSTKKPARSERRRRFESLEDRSMMATFTVLNLNDSGAGSLRQAILDANNTAGADSIHFDTSGTINLKSALPKITDKVAIDGSTATGFEDSPVIEINFNKNAGLHFITGSTGSTLQSLALVGASTSGAKIDGVGEMLIVGNFFGLRTDGTTVGMNYKHGLELIGSNNNTIGGSIDEARNVFSGNKLTGLEISGSSFNEIQGNYFGTDATGMLNRGNGRNGITITDGSFGNVVGGDGKNVISGNKSHGLTINGGSQANAVRGNIIGLNASGTGVLGNKSDGIRVENATDNLIGNDDAVRGVDYYNTDYITDSNDDPVQVNGWQGIRGGDVEDEYIITGTSGDYGLLYRGSLDGKEGTAYTFMYPDAMTTSAYGPSNLGDGWLQVVGTYKNSDYQTADVTVNGFLFMGKVGDLDTAGNYYTINYPDAKFNYVHSVSGSVAVGNYDSPEDHGLGNLSVGPGHAFIFDTDEQEFIGEVKFPGALSTTAYGVWYNGGDSYTIVGGYSLELANNFDDQDRPIGSAYIVDYDKATGEFTNWKSFDYPLGENIVTHFQGISSVEEGVYTLGADSIQLGTEDPAMGSLVTIRRNTDGSFGEAAWVDLTYTDPETGETAAGITSSNSVYGNAVVGIVINNDSFSYQAKVDVGFQLSNVISGNGGNGIGLYGASNNQVQMNYIGTDITGTVDLGNGANGILITARSANNLIGGEVTGGNDPTDGVFVQPPMGNVISGNNANGVLINDRATGNQLSGNFIGTDATGNVPLGNSKDGVFIDKADGNMLIGCTFQEDPFVFYNVVSGNGGNGLRVNNSNNTTIQANFFGIGADNDTDVGNALSGVVIQGSSSGTTMGGPIPLGNVTAGNGQNGLVVEGKASNFVSYNTFAGVAAFSTNQTLGNDQDGMLITSTGSNILIRTNVISSNGDDGIEVSGKAKGVQITSNIIGLNTSGISAMGNGDNGIEVSGKVQGILIGGTLNTPSIIPQNTISGNEGYGVAILNGARNITVNNSYIGADIFGLEAVGNALSGVYLGAKTSGNTIGSTNADLKTVISGNLGDGVTLDNTSGNTILGALLGVDGDGELPLGNGGNGITLTNSSKNTIGGTVTGAGNIIAFNTAGGVVIESGTQNAIWQNSIYSNEELGIDLGSGANQNQPAPVLQSVVQLIGSTEIEGTLTAKKKTTYTLEFFASNTSNGSGKVYLGSLTVKTDKSGVAEFTADLPSAPNGLMLFTATATDSKGNTSEFSNVVAPV